jgi:hypothetical protein
VVLVLIQSNTTSTRAAEITGIASTVHAFGTAETLAVLALFVFITDDAAGSTVVSVVL